MNLNENLKTRRKQLAILAAVITAVRPQRAVLSGTDNTSRSRSSPHRSPRQT